MANETAEETVARLEAVSARVDEIDGDIVELQLLIQNTTGVPEAVTNAINALALKVNAAADRVPEPEA